MLKFVVYSFFLLWSFRNEKCNTAPISFFVSVCLSVCLSVPVAVKQLENRLKIFVKFVTGEPD
jgi:hypothetical protein